MLEPLKKKKILSKAEALGEEKQNSPCILKGKNDL